MTYRRSLLPGDFCPSEHHCKNCSPSFETHLNSVLVVIRSLGQMCHDYNEFSCRVHCTCWLVVGSGEEKGNQHVIGDYLRVTTVIPSSFPLRKSRMPGNMRIGLGGLCNLHPATLPNTRMTNSESQGSALKTRGIGVAHRQ